MVLNTCVAQRLASVSDYMDRCARPPARLADAEINGPLNRTPADLRLPGKKARALLEDMSTELEDRQDKV